MLPRHTESHAIATHLGAGLLLLPTPLERNHAASRVGSYSREDAARLIAIARGGVQHQRGRWKRGGFRHETGVAEAVPLPWREWEKGRVCELRGRAS